MISINTPLNHKITIQKKDIDKLRDKHPELAGNEYLIAIALTQPDEIY